MPSVEMESKIAAPDLKIVICGVGGQGVLYFAKNLYALAIMAGAKVLGSETHGMSQRGGSVVSHVKIGEYSSPMVQKGTADLLFSLKAGETFAYLAFVRQGSRIVVNAPDGFQLSANLQSILKEMDVSTDIFDASGRAMVLGQPAAANIVLLAHACSKGLLPFSVDRLKDAVKAVTASARLETALKALQAGLE